MKTETKPRPRREMDYPGCRGTCHFYADGSVAWADERCAAHNPSPLDPPEGDG